MIYNLFYIHIASHACDVYVNVCSSHPFLRFSRLTDTVAIAIHTNIRSIILLCSQPAKSKILFVFDITFGMEQ